MAHRTVNRPNESVVGVTIETGVPLARLDARAATLGGRAERLRMDSSNAMTVFSGTP